MDPNDDGDDDFVWLPDDIDAKVLDSKTRNGLGSGKFAVPGKRKLPINDAAHVRNALARINQTKGLTPAERKTALAKIHRAAKKFGVKVEADASTISAMKLMAVSLDLPHVDGHPNRMPFSGILTRIDVASDKAPSGAGGKRVLLTRAAAENALESLLGMGVDLTKDMDGHDAQKKVGIITSAHIDGDALMISGFIYASDFPREALRIHLDQADLGFSFEARNLAVESVETDPLVVKSCVFTGAAILLKNEAAYQTTALAAAKAKEHEMDEVQKAVAAALAEALGPISKTLSDVAAAQAAQGVAIEELRTSPPVAPAVAAAIAKVAPHVAALEAAAAQLEKDGVGSASQVASLRRLAAMMRQEASLGRMPHDIDMGGSVAASVATALPVAAVPAVKIEDTPEFKAMKASAEANALELKAAKDAAAALETKFNDLNSKVNGLRPSPDRKTIDPSIGALLARAGLQAPEEGQMLSVSKVDAAISAMPGGMDTAQRMHLKTALSRAGVLSPNGAG